MVVEGKCVVAGSFRCGVGEGEESVSQHLTITIKI